MVRVEVPLLPRLRGAAVYRSACVRNRLIRSLGGSEEHWIRVVMNRETQRAINYHPWLHSLKNDPRFPVSCWALAFK